jgi:hypothetical protein
MPNVRMHAWHTPVDCIRRGLECCHHFIYDIRLQQRLVTLDVDHYIVLLVQFADCFMTPLSACGQSTCRSMRKAVPWDDKQLRSMYCRSICGKVLTIWAAV